MNVNNGHLWSTILLLIGMLIGVILFIYGLTHDWPVMMAAALALVAIIQTIFNKKSSPPL